MFWDDAPIKISEEDSLGRRRFAEALGQNLLAFQQEESVVVGLFGPWGSGKTSLVNMIVEKISSASAENAPIIIKFNPWNFSNTNELLLAFFTQVFSIVGRKSQRFKKTVSKRLKNYGKALKQAGNIPMVGTFMGSFGGFIWWIP